jgi:hypothetical protein
MIRPEWLIRQKPEARKAAPAEKTLRSIPPVILERTADGCLVYLVTWPHRVESGIDDQPASDGE